MAAADVESGRRSVEEPMAGRDEFESLFREFLQGNLTRRQAMLRAAGLGAGAAVAGPRLVGAAPAGRASGFVVRGQDGSPTPKTGGVLKMGMQSDPSALDPQKQSLTAIWHVVEHIYNCLTKIQPDLSVAPDLAESWDISADGLTYTFKLHQGVKFHNGREAVAKDVKYSFERLVDPATASTSAANLASMASIEAPDDYTAVLKLKARDASILANLANSSCIIIPKEVVDQNGDLSQVAVGTGPFVFKQYTPNTSITLDKNPDYFEKGLPYLDGVEMLIAAEDTSRTAALVQGTADFIEYTPPKDIAMLKSDSSIALAGNSIQQIRMIGFNLRKDPFKNAKVRQAINLVVDRKAIIDAALQGFGTPADIPFSQDYWAALKRDVPAPDVAKAQQLMAEAGFKDGFKTSITTWAEYVTIKDSAVVVQEQLKKIGIAAELNALDTGTMSSTVYQKFDFDMAVTGDSAFVDPDQLVGTNFKTGDSGNFVGYSNPDVDKLIGQGIAETDQAKRAEIYQQIQQILLQDLPWVCLYIGQQYEAMKTYVKGYQHIPTGSNLKVREVWLDK
jgi:peptide/nickel transport system substrate-binding protein